MFKNRIPRIWNKPGGQGNGGNPWGRKGGEQGPPDLDQVFRQFYQRLKRVVGGNTPGDSGTEFHFFGGILLVLLLVLYVISGIYIVDPQERAVVMRFGKYVHTEGPGPHWLLPVIESKEIINVEQVSTSDHSGLVLTKDGNIVSVGVAVQYRISEGNKDVQAFLFNVVNPIRSLNQSTESALRQVVGQSTMDEVLTLKRSEIALAIKEQIIATLKNYHTGIRILDVLMQFAKAPDEVRAAFDEVIKASADEERLVNQAIAYENEVLPRAKGSAESLRNEALGYKQETILMAEGNVQRFNLILPQYLKAPKVTQTRLYLDTLEQVLAKTSKVIVNAGTGNNLIYLPLDRLMTERQAGDTPATIEPSSSAMRNSLKGPLATLSGLQKEKSQ
jgi:membrane protease subunit HflK